MDNNDPPANHFNANHHSNSDYHHLNHDYQANNNQHANQYEDQEGESDCLNINDIFSSGDDQTLNGIFSSTEDNQSLRDSPAFVADNLLYGVSSTVHGKNNGKATCDEKTTQESSTSVERIEASECKKRKLNSCCPADESRRAANSKSTNIPILSLKIGPWEKHAKHNEELIAKCYFKKNKMALEVLHDKKKTKLEFEFSDIDAINFEYVKGKEVLYIRLKTRPKFFRGEEEPKKHTNWQVCPDFTAEQAATTSRVHRLEFSPGVLKKHYYKIISFDSKLEELSKQEFPKNQSPLFDDVNRVPYTKTTDSLVSTISRIPTTFGLPRGRNFLDHNISKYANHDHSARDYRFHDHLYYDNCPLGVSGHSNSHFPKLILPSLVFLNNGIGHSSVIARDILHETPPTNYWHPSTLSPVALNNGSIPSLGRIHGRRNKWPYRTHSGPTTSSLSEALNNASIPSSTSACSRLQPARSSPAVLSNMNISSSSLVSLNNNENISLTPGLNDISASRAKTSVDAREAAFKHVQHSGYSNNSDFNFK